MTVHILKYGLALCGAGMPNTWPDSDRWVGFLDTAKHHEVDCHGCIFPAPVDPKDLPAELKVDEGSAGKLKLAQYLMLHSDVCFTIFVGDANVAWRFGCWCATRTRRLKIGPGRSWKLLFWAELLGQRKGGMKFDVTRDVGPGELVAVPLYRDPFATTPRLR